MNKAVKTLLFALLFVASFLLFLFLTFPYEVLKESIAAEVTKATGYPVRIGEMSAALPLGVEAANVRVDSPAGGASINLSDLEISINPFALLIGKLNATVEAASGGGDLTLGIDFGIIDLIRGASTGEVLPRRISLDANSFPLDQAVQFGLASVASSPNANPMLTPILSAIGFSGQMSGTADLKLDSSNPTQSTGALELSLVKAILKLSHPSLGLPDQEFVLAKMKASVENGAIVLDKSSGLVSDELELLPEGKVALKQVPTDSQLDLRITLKLNKGLKEKFGFLIDAFTGKAASDGVVNMQVRGPLQQPSVTF